MAQAWQRRRVVQEDVCVAERLRRHPHIRLQGCFETSASLVNEELHLKAR